MKATPRMTFPCEKCGKATIHKKLTYIPWKDGLLSVCPGCERRTRNRIERRID
jgi:hypothetical protein